ncbi:COG4315 family predicted lipoprotein [Pontibacter cellulosilyticus]|uniref:Lipoprotein with Yx(FWY)xxD motif n=1 Tax=Pontibacter cellulosilyticus TaxID=1720253 RepID=A0A923N3I0_9BACT|nr:hypothetical protein [Pontibacter cellulosilyticus]MBC5991566.1 hypothetical protein [Pontibacter cellulosilyticus]
MKTNFYSLKLISKQALTLLFCCGILIACGGGDTLTEEAANETAQADANVDMDANTNTNADVDQATSVRLETRTSEGLGTYLTDGSGRSLYLFKADTSMNSTCYDACAQAWPPLMAQGTPTAGDGVNASLIGTIERKGDGMQVTYNGWPLYYYVKDQGAGQTTGQDVKGFGAEWYLISPQGKEVHSEGHKH